MDKGTPVCSFVQPHAVMPANTAQSLPCVGRFGFQGPSRAQVCGHWPRAFRWSCSQGFFCLCSCNFCLQEQPCHAKVATACRSGALPPLLWLSVNHQAVVDPRGGDGTALLSSLQCLTLHLYSELFSMIFWNPGSRCDWLQGMSSLIHPGRSAVNFCCSPSLLCFYSGM